jgi:NAD(P)H-hydrate epimerase
MQEAGEAAYDYLRQRWPNAGRLCVICGTGNNGGDGLILASLALRSGLAVQVFLAGVAEAMVGDAALARDQWLAIANHHAVRPWALTLEELDPSSYDVVVDGLFGTGLNRPLDQQTCELIETINSMGCPVLALDCPSGLHADTGRALPVAIRATATVTFIVPKRGLLTGHAGDHTGDIVLAALGADAADLSAVAADVVCPHLDELRQTLPSLPAAVHKYQRGKLVIVGGGPGMAGAAILAGEAALMAGAGLVCVASTDATCGAAVVRYPELLARPVASPEDLRDAIPKARALVLGPGLGTTPWAASLLDFALQSSLPLVLDADALTLLKDRVELLQDRSAPVILTPHEGEAARLLDVSADEIGSDRFAAVTALSARYAATVVLKGHGTLVSSANLALPIVLCPLGNPGMAVGGMGDVLSGVLGALLAQGLTTDEAAVLGVFLHAAAGDRCAEAHGLRGLLPSEVAKEIRLILKPSV